MDARRDSPVRGQITCNITHSTCASAAGSAHLAKFSFVHAPLTREWRGELVRLRMSEGGRESWRGTGSRGRTMVGCRRRE
eukprot:2466917-Rhodomonas_salina.1